MGISAHREVNSLVADVHNRLVRLLSGNLVGVYVFGSVASGAYQPGVSDVDLLAVSAHPLAAAEYAQLELMHTALAAEHQQWANRVEVAYLSRAALRTFKERTSQIGIISPGEPFHVVTAGRDWLMNWYDVREHAIIVGGPDPKTLIDPIAPSELQACVREYLQLFRERVRHNPHRGSDAYAVLTMCRGLHTGQMGQTATKEAAAQWATLRFPEWHELIAQAQRWRLAADNEAINSDETHAEVEAFVDFAIRAFGQP